MVKLKDPIIEPPKIELSEFEVKKEEKNEKKVAPAKETKKGNKKR